MVRLANVVGTTSDVPLAEVLSSPGFALLSPGSPAAPLAPSGLLDGVTEAVAEQARWWERHIVEILTGLPPGPLHCPLRLIQERAVGILRHMPAGTESLPREARAALDDYLTALDAALPGIACGIYVTGSAVLGDWRPGRSDLDILTVTERGLDDAGLTALEALHAGIPGRPYRDAIYIPAEAIGAPPVPTAGDGTDPAPAGRYPSAVDGVFHRARYCPDPVLWATLDRHGLTVRG